MKQGEHNGYAKSVGFKAGWAAPATEAVPGGHCCPGLVRGDRWDRCAEEGGRDCPPAARPADDGGRGEMGVSCSSNDTGVSCTEAGRPRRADEGGLAVCVSCTECGLPKMERRTDEGPPGLSRMLASEAAQQCRGASWLQVSTAGQRHAEQAAPKGMATLLQQQHNPSHTLKAPSVLTLARQRGQGLCCLLQVRVLQAWRGRRAGLSGGAAQGRQRAALQSL